jgi:hypothetical protein
VYAALDVPAPDDLDQDGPRSSEGRRGRLPRMTANDSTPDREKGTVEYSEEEIEEAAEGLEKVRHLVAGAGSDLRRREPGAMDNCREAVQELVDVLEVLETQPHEAGSAVEEPEP